ncbi:hypothetical protein [Vitreimonas sp.]|uniref:hypothetical protein n=1 Tax=Vitreimonas sp. TaxID=3069702 RepID=UPI002ED8F8E8
MPRIGHRQRSEVGGASGKSHPARVQPARFGAYCATTWKNRCADKPLRLSKVQRILSCHQPFVLFRLVLSNSALFSNQTFPAFQAWIGMLPDVESNQGGEMIVYSTLQREHPLEMSKVTSDPHAICPARSDSSKSLAECHTTHMETHCATVEAPCVADAHSAFVSANSRSGPAPIAAGELARIEYCLTLAERLLGSAGPPSGGSAPPAAGLNALLPDEYERALRFQFATVPDQHLAARPHYNVWCFREDAGVAFSSSDERLYARRLNVARAKDAVPDDAPPLAFRYTGLLVEEAASPWSTPTFADCTWRDLRLWVPGGRTNPTDTACGPGLAECVGVGILFKHVKIAFAAQEMDPIP